MTVCAMPLSLSESGVEELNALADFGVFGFTDQYVNVILAGSRMGSSK